MTSTGEAKSWVTCPERGVREHDGNAVTARALEERFAERREEREALVERKIAPMGVVDPKVLAAMKKVPRHRFVPQDLADRAYRDYPLALGLGQTISQPFIVAYMTERAEVQPTDRCLEVGTGSGYQAAILAELSAEVYSIEYFPTLAERARVNLESLGYRVHQRIGDGRSGWIEAAPFDVILVTAAPLTIPRTLLLQLAVGGRLIVPVGPQRRTQVLELWRRLSDATENDAFVCESLTFVEFVPFLGGDEVQPPDEE
ncbi:MAG: protein-L-isoaspartate(D-aspartate) O-methyltransferase [Polyangiaceae bacterium]